jgi:diguanylate cyclase (GGDEF)-like protein
LAAVDEVTPSDCEENVRKFREVISSETASSGPSPSRLLNLYMLVVVTTTAVAIAVVMMSALRIDIQAGRSARKSDAAVTTARIQAELGEPTVQLVAGYLSFFGTPAFAALPPEVQDDARHNLAAAIQGQPIQPTDVVRMSLPERELLGLHDRLELASANIDRLLADSSGVSALGGIGELTSALNASFDAYVSNPTLSSYNEIFRAIILLRGELNRASSLMAAELSDGRSELESNASFARYAMGAALVGLMLITAAATLVIGRMLRFLFRRSQQGRESLQQATESLTYRNQQLTALYNVFSEITETLSLRYVINATLRESLKVMNADVVVLRLLKGDELVFAGALTNDGVEFETLPPVPLGQGPNGRAARRGRTVHIREDAQGQLGPSPDPAKRVESGMVVPLIVGARVVGTIACWSRKLDAFNEDDARILEMMASQVATAVIAADTTDLNDHRARHDPLTGLPNRVQLAGDLGALGSQGRKAVVAMADIDHFKRFNDDFSHRVGDVTLQKVASVLRTAVRDVDRVYRYGGEEFVLVFVDAGANEAVALADRVRAAVESTPLSGDNLEPVGPVTISIGLAVLPDHGADLASLIEKADSAMYCAKQMGRNRVILWQEVAEPAALVA